MENIYLSIAKDFANDVVRKGQRKVGTYDYVYAQYLYHNHFYNELTRILSELSENDEFTLPTGEKLRADSIGDLAGFQIYLETLDATKEAMTGLSKKGLQAEVKSLTSHR
ncbi:hypothetical protein ACFL96_00925 [Thermoproteota archaeon]